MQLARVTALTAFGFSTLAYAATVPPQAAQYFPLLKWESENTLHSTIAPSVLASQIEQETCINRKLCWNPRARRFVPGVEEGIGLGQVTRTWHRNGSIRFDTLTELRGDDSFLTSWNWTDPYNPNYQLRALAIMDRKCLRSAEGALDEARVAMALSCYNGGSGDVKAGRLMCRSAKSCNRNLWWENVEFYSKKSRLVSNNQKSNFTINREYVYNILKIRLKKYLMVNWNSVS